LKDVAIQHSKVVAMATSPLQRHSQAPRHRETDLVSHLEEYKRIAGKPFDEWDLALCFLEAAKNSPAAEWTGFYSSTLTSWKKRYADGIFKFADFMEAIKYWAQKHLPAYVHAVQGKGKEKALLADAVKTDKKDKKVGFSADAGRVLPSSSARAQDGDKHCSLHGKGNHSSDECRVLKNKDHKSSKASKNSKSKSSHGEAAAKSQRSASRSASPARGAKADEKTGAGLPDKFKHVKCYTCGNMGHPASRCPDNETANFVGVVCYGQPISVDFKTSPGDGGYSGDSEYDSSDDCRADADDFDGGRADIFLRVFKSLHSDGPDDVHADIDASDDDDHADDTDDAECPDGHLPRLDVALERDVIVATSIPVRASALDLVRLSHDDYVQEWNDAGLQAIRQALNYYSALQQAHHPASIDRSMEDSLLDSARRFSIDDDTRALRARQQEIHQRRPRGHFRVVASWRHLLARLGCHIDVMVSLITTPPESAALQRWSLLARRLTARTAISSYCLDVDFADSDADDDDHDDNRDGCTINDSAADSEDDTGSSCVDSDYTSTSDSDYTSTSDSDSTTFSSYCSDVDSADEDDDASSYCSDVDSADEDDDASSYCPDVYSSDDDDDDDCCSDDGSDDNNPARLTFVFTAAGPWSATTVDDDEALLDSGASITLLKMSEFFDEDTYGVSTVRLTVANGGTMQATGEGIATLRLTDVHGEAITVRVRALHCPQMPHNLISLSSLIDEGWTAQFAAPVGHLLSPTGHSVPLARRHTLWALPLAAQPQAVLCALAAPITLSPIDLLHLRFGHLHHDALIKGSRFITGLPHTLRASDLHGVAPCHECMRAKSRRTGPGQLGVIYHESANQPLSIINIDLSGPHRTFGVGPDGQENIRYSLIIVDSFTLMRWDVPLTAKSEVVDALRDWLNYTHSTCRHRVQRIHGDHDSTFTSASMTALCQEFAIGQSWSSVDEPRQNPYAERSIGITTTLARSMLATSNAPIKLWWLARQYASEILNMFAMSHDAIPYELFHQKFPNGSLYFPFGCFAWIWTDRKHSNDPKFISAGQKGIIVGTGLSNGKKAFRVYTDDGKIKYAVSVTVDMTYFPYRPAGERRLTSAFFNGDFPSTEHCVSWDEGSSPLDRYDAVYADMTVDNADDFISSEPDYAVDHVLDDFVLPEYAAREGGSITDIPVTERGTQRTLSGADVSDSVGTTSDDDDDDDVAAKISLARSDNLRLSDGTCVVDLIGRRTELLWSNNEVYHGVVKDFRYNPSLKIEGRRFTFITEYEEDGKIMNHYYEWGRYPLKKILVKTDDVGDAAVFYAQDAIEEDKYLPDVVSSRKEMLQQPDSKHFLSAEHVEIENMKKHGVLEWVHCPRGARLVRSKFTYKRKRDANGEIEKYKARMVARGFTQIYGVDFNETFAPVATATAFRLLMVTAMIHNLHISGGDIDGAFLNAELEEEIYMSPDGYEDPTGGGRVFKLLKSIYGLKQSANCWFKLLSSTLRNLGYSPLDGSDCFWILYNGDDCISLLVMHVDDYVHAFSDPALNDRIVSVFTELWGVSGVGPVKMHLGMHVEYEAGKRVRIHQRTYIEKILKRFNMSDAKPQPTPMDPYIKLSSADCPETPNVDDRKLFAEMYGSALYAAVTTRPDLAKAMTALGKYMTNPGPSHIQGIKRVFRYLAGTVNQGLEYRNEPWKTPALPYSIAVHEPVTFTDSDWAGEQDNLYSTTGTLTFLAGGPIAWKAVLQRIQAQSSGEAEYIAMSDGAKDILYVRRVLYRMGFYRPIGPTRMLVDSTAAIAIASKPGITSKTKHIALRYHFIRKLIADGLIQTVKVPTLDNVADVLTKAVEKQTFVRLAPFIVRTMTD